MISKLTPEEKIIRAKLELVKSNPFFASIVGQLEMVEVEPTHSVIKTMATNGKHLYYNPVFISSLSNSSVLFGVIHEVLHIVMMSFERKGSREHSLWNKATDFANNQIIKDSKFLLPNDYEMSDALKAVYKAHGIDVPDESKFSILYDPKYRDIPAEEIYELLKEEESGDDSGTFDTHLTDGLPGDPLNEDETSIWIPSESEKKLLNRRNQSIIESAANMAGSNVPDEVKRFIGSLKESKVSWRDVLRHKISPSEDNEYTMTPPDMNYFSSGISLPSNVHGDMLSAVLVIDTSGSISDKSINAVMSEISGICETFHNYELTVVVFGTDIVDVVEFEPGDNIEYYRPPEGGGTNFENFFKYLSGEVPFKSKYFDKTDDTNVVIVFTDGFGESWCEQYSSIFDVVWLINSDGKKAGVEPPWGTTVFYDEYEK